MVSRQKADSGSMDGIVEMTGVCVTLKRLKRSTKFFFYLFFSYNSDGVSVLFFVIALILITSTTVINCSYSRIWFIYGIEMPIVWLEKIGWKNSANYHTQQKANVLMFLSFVAYCFPLQRLAEVT